MLFHSTVFLLLFLPLVLSGYYVLAGRRRARTWFLIVASFAFYAYWDARLVPLLALSISINWLLALAYAKRPRAALVGVGVALNLVVLGVFKYADFVSAAVASLAGVGHDPWGIALPLGISFFTFQQISYLSDLRRGRAPLYRFEDYALYVSVFPHLVAGPIIRHHELIPQFALAPMREGLDERLSRGLVLVLIGLMKKTFLADELARIADPLFAAAAAGQALGVVEGWAAALAFGFQIYFDFSGYTDMAIGLALLLGLTLPLNFNAPYRATSVREFWRRWHMTLSRFLRDYLYIPLGGSRKGTPRLAVAVLLTMLLGGLWHGAASTFIAWGGMHGLGLLCHRVWGATGLRLPGPFAWLLTMVFVTFAWVLFRAEGFGAALDLWQAMVGFEGWSAEAKVEKPWLIAAAGAVVLLLPTSQRMALERLVPSRPAAVGAGAALVLALLRVGGGENAEFIYFQF